MKKTIHLTEQDLHNMIKEAIGELKNQTYRNAYKKMVDMGQDDRAREFARSHDDHYSDTEAGIVADLADNSVDIMNKRQAGNQTSGTISNRFYADGSRWGGGHEYEPSNRNEMPRTNDRKRINKQVSALDHFYGGKENNPFSKNDFIAEKELHEAITRAIRKLSRNSFFVP